MKRWTKWIPLGRMDFGGKDYVTLVRKNRKTGMLKFKTLRVNGWRLGGSVYSFLPSDLIDTNEAWKQITEL